MGFVVIRSAIMRWRKHTACYFDAQMIELNHCLAAMLVINHYTSNAIIVSFDIYQ